MRPANPTSLLSTRVGPRASWRTSVILAVAFWSAALGLHVVLAHLAWWLVVSCLCTAVLAAAAAVRAVSPWRALAPVAAAATLLGLLTAFFAPGSGILALIPTGETWDRFGALFTSAVDSINHQSVPADAGLAIVFLLCAGIGSMAVLADLLAIGLARPALAGIPLLVILAVPAITASGLTDVVIFVVVAGVYLWLLQLGGRGRPARISVGLGAGMLAATLVLPALLPAVAEAPSFGGRGAGFVAGVNPVINLGADLRRGAVQTALTYSTNSGTGNYLRLVSLQNFSGDGWSPDKVTFDTNNTPDEFGPPPGLFPEVASSLDTTYITVDQLDSPWLPVPYPSTSVTGLKGDWFWEKDALTVSSPDRSTWGEHYVVHSLVLAPTPEQLALAGTTVPDGFERYLELPDGMPEIIASTARKVASSAPSNYEKALALQEYFRHGDFEYSETAPVRAGYDGSGADVIAKFLQVKSGYCVHFASAMTVMARSIGIPARMAVGFLPGTLTANQTDGRSIHRVTTHELHTWPELYFDGVGWVRFEPTVSRGEVPDYAIQGLNGVPVPPPPAAVDPAPPSNAPIAPDQSAPAAPDDAAAAGTDPGATDPAGAWLLGIGGVLAVIILGLIPAVVRASQRLLVLMRLSRGSGSAVDAWTEVLRSAEDLELPVALTDSPRKAAGRIATAAGIVVDGAFAQVLAGVERESYARSVLARPLTARDVLSAIAQLGGPPGLGARVRAVLVPLSVWNRMLAPFSRAG